MSDQKSEISELHTLYFNTSDASGFEVCEEIGESEEKITIFRPINKDDGLIYSNISEQGQDYQIKHIKLYNFICRMHQEAKTTMHKEAQPTMHQEAQNTMHKEAQPTMHQEAQNTMHQEEQNKNSNQSEQKNEGDFIDLSDKNDYVNSLIQQNNKKYPSETEVILRQQINKQIFPFEQVNDDSITFCLLYDNQELQEINSQIDSFKGFFKGRKTNIVIVINGKKKCKFHQNFNLEEKEKENKCNNSISYLGNICYSYEYKECIFLVINEEQSTIRLLNWIYRGIFKHFQSEYFYVGSLSIHVDKEKFQYMDRMIRSPNYCGATGYYNLIHVQNESKIINLNYSFVGYMNFLNYQFQIDSLAQLKRFHNPFFSYYKWNECYNYFDNYIKELEIENQKGNLNLHLNPILPLKMFKEKQKQFFSASSHLGEKKIIPDNQAQMFLDLSNMMYSITQCNDYALNMHSLVYTLLLELRKFDSKVKLAQILFLYTFSPYQAYFYLNISRSYVKIIISILCPFSLFILLLLFVLLVQQYQIGISIVKKKKIRNLDLLLTGNVLEILFKSKITKINNISEYQRNSSPITIENQKKQYRFEQLIQQLPTHQCEERIRNAQSSSQMQRSQTENNINSQQQLLINKEEENSGKIFKLSIQSSSEKKVDHFYVWLFRFTYFIEICCSVMVILNLIFTYGINLIQDVQDEQHYATIIGILIFIGVFILRNGIKIDQFWVSLLVPIQIFLNLLITTVYSEMYHILRIKIKPKEYLEQVQKLSQYLCLNILFLIIFYIVETSMNFEGYIFSIIIFYNLTLYLIDSLFVIGALLNGCIKQSTSPINTKTENKSENKYEKFLDDYKKIVHTYITDLRKEQQQYKNENNPNPTRSNASIYSQNRSHQDLITPKEVYTSHEAIQLDISQSSELYYM